MQALNEPTHAAWSAYCRYYILPDSLNLDTLLVDLDRPKVRPKRPERVGAGAGTSLCPCCLPAPLSRLHHLSSLHLICAQAGDSVDETCWRSACSWCCSRQGTRPGQGKRPAMRQHPRMTSRAQMSVQSVLGKNVGNLSYERSQLFGVKLAIIMHGGSVQHCGVDM